MGAGSSAAAKSPAGETSSGQDGYTATSSPAKVPPANDRSRTVQALPKQKHDKKATFSNERSPIPAHLSPFVGGMDTVRKAHAPDDFEFLHMLRDYLRLTGEHDAFRDMLVTANGDGGYFENGVSTSFVPLSSSGKGKGRMRSDRADNVILEEMESNYEASIAGSRDGRDEEGRRRRRRSMSKSKLSSSNGRSLDERAAKGMEHALKAQGISRKTVLPPLAATSTDSGCDSPVRTRIVDIKSKYASAKTLESPYMAIAEEGETPIQRSRGEASSGASEDFKNFLASSVGSGEFTAVFNSILESILVTDDKGRIIAVNNATLSLLGYDATELLGQDVAIIVDPFHRSSHSDYIRNYITTGMSKIIGTKGRELNAISKDGVAIPIRLTVGEAQKQKGGSVFAGVLHDMRYEKLLKREAERREAAEGEKMAMTTFIQCTSHDLRTPLQAIAHVVDYLKDTVSKWKDSYKKLEKSRRLLEFGQGIGETSSLKLGVADMPDRPSPIPESSAVGDESLVLAAGMISTASKSTIASSGHGSGEDGFGGGGGMHTPTSKRNLRTSGGGEEPQYGGDHALSLRWEESMSKALSVSKGELPHGKTVAFFEELEELIPVLSSSTMLSELIVSNVLDVQKIETSAIEVHQYTNDVAEAVRDMAAVVEKSIAGKEGVEVITDVQPASLHAICDGKRIVRSVMNLLTNALKFTKEGSVTVHMHMHERPETPVAQAQAQAEAARPGTSGSGVSRKWRNRPMMGVVRQSDEAIGVAVTSATPPSTAGSTRGREGDMMGQQRGGGYRQQRPSPVSSNMVTIPDGGVGEGGGRRPMLNRTTSATAMASSPTTEFNPAARQWQSGALAPATPLYGGEGSADNSSEGGGRGTYRDVSGMSTPAGGRGSGRGGAPPESLLSRPASSVGGTSFSVGPDQRLVTFAVVDTGCGMTEDEMRKATEPYVRAETSKGGGIGLGLFIVKNNVEALGGELKITSQLDVGTTMSFTIPITLDQQELSTLEEGDGDEDGNGEFSMHLPKRPRTGAGARSHLERIDSAEDLGLSRILFVEDVAINRKMGVRMLKSLGYDVVACNDGKEAVEALRNDRMKMKERTSYAGFDVAFLDLNMPVMNGDEAVKEYRVWEKNFLLSYEGERYIEPIFCCAMSGDVTKESRDLCKKTGFDAFISKPFRKEDMVEVIERRGSKL
mmetsp:Transcript_6542/g.16224  ORF Transcript_6542/g.16224 Transcript_6542/m.16224 type:complete len:1185 (-) Transcript_6542:456-4010(-)